MVGNFVKVPETEHRPRACQMILVDPDLLKNRACSSVCICYQSTCLKPLPGPEVLLPLFPLPLFICAPGDELTL